MIYKYTLGFIKRKHEILMLNRNKQPWKGSWNGIGGKLELCETPLECIIRETFEETGIKVQAHQVHDCGIVTWGDEALKDSGLHVFLIEVADDFYYQTPIATREGILDWKIIDFLKDRDNGGLAHNIPYFIDDVIEKKYLGHVCLFEGERLMSVTKKVIK